MWNASAEAIHALSSNHEMQVKVNVFTRAGLRASDIPIEGGNITATLLSDVCRSGSLLVSPHLISAGLLDPRRDRVQIFTGPRGYPLIPIFTGRVVDRSEPSGGVVQVQVEDYGRDIVDARFEEPWQADIERSIPWEMRRIIQDVDETFSVNLAGAIPGPTPNVVWDENRAGALDELAAATNTIWQSDRSGGFDVFPNPYRLAVVTPPRLTLTTGPGGTLTSYTENTTRDNVYNSMTVLVERADNEKPVRVTVRDNRPGSAFRWGGEYGKVNRVVRLQTPGGESAALAMAQRLLNQSLGLFRSWRLTTPHFPLLDPGDVIGAREGGETTIQVVETVSYPLAAIDATAIATRELRYNEEIG